MTWAIIACGSTKAGAPAPAAELYTSSTFRLNLAAARAIAGDQVLVLSALHGLIPVDQVVAPYDVKMGDDGSVTADLVAAQLLPLVDLTRWAQEVYVLAPRAYADLVDDAARLLDVTVTWINEADAGVGYQRGTAATIARAA